MNTDDKLVIGMPSGSLADPKRGGNLVSVLENAGFSTRGYDSGGPTSFTTINFLYGWDGRPQEFGSQLGIREIDIAISGDDWILERTLELQLGYHTEVHLQKVLPLQRGGVKLVGIADPAQHSDIKHVLTEWAEKDGLLTVVSELPYVALDWLFRRIRDFRISEEMPQFSIQKYKTPPKIDTGIVIYETWGKTEAKVKNGGVDIGMEITQSGRALRNYGLTIIDTVLESEAGIWIHPDIKQDPEKYALLRMFLLNMYGALNAEDKVMLVFNVPNQAIPEVEEYLNTNNLFADEPTMKRGKEYTEYTIQVSTVNSENPIAKIRYELALRRATNIDTIPVISSIPSIDAVDI